MTSIMLSDWVLYLLHNHLIQERIEGTEKASLIHTLSIGNSSGVIFRIGIKLPRALRGCFVEVPHD